MDNKTKTNKKMDKEYDVPEENRVVIVDNLLEYMELIVSPNGKGIIIHQKDPARPNGVNIVTDLQTGAILADQIKRRSDILYGSDEVHEKLIEYMCGTDEKPCMVRHLCCPERNPDQVAFCLDASAGGTGPMQDRIVDGIAHMPECDRCFKPDKEACAEKRKCAECDNAATDVQNGRQLCQDHVRY